MSSMDANIGKQEESLMDAKTQIEYDRIKAGPHEGRFTFLHHEGPVVEESKNVMERVGFILRDKPETEHYDRLRHIYYVPLKIMRVYDAAMAEPQRVYDAAMAEAEKPIVALIPDCAWDGNTIFGGNADA